MGEKQFLLVEDHPEGGEMIVTNKYSGGEDISTIGVGSGPEEVILTAIDNPGYEAETGCAADSEVLSSAAGHQALAVGGGDHQGGQGRGGVRGGLFLQQVKAAPSLWRH